MNINFTKFKKALSDKTALDFVIELRLKNYESLPKTNFTTVKNHFEKSVKKLSTSLDSPLKFNNALNYIVDNLSDLYSKPWFFGFEYEYRKEKTIVMEYGDIFDHIIGKKVLDLGCGSGDLSYMLEKKHKDLTLVDMTDYRTEKNKKLNFLKSFDSSKIPLDDKSMDTSLVFSMLHHNSLKDIKKLLNELIRVTKRRLIIKEDTYNLEGGLLEKTLKTKEKKDEMIQRFVKLSTTSQFNVLILSDFISNVIIQNNISINFPFNFLDDPSWKNLFKEFNLKLKHVHLDGMRRDGSDYYGSCHIYYILDIIR